MKLLLFLVTSGIIFLSGSAYLDHLETRSFIREYVRSETRHEALAAIAAGTGQLKTADFETVEAGLPPSLEQPNPIWERTFKILAGIAALGTLFQVLKLSEEDNWRFAHRS